MVLNMFLSFGHLRKSAFALFLNLKVFHLNIALPHLWCFQFSSSHSNVMVLQSPVSEGISIYAQCICLFLSLLQFHLSAVLILAPDISSRLFLCVLFPSLSSSAEREKDSSVKAPAGPEDLLLFSHQPVLLRYITASCCRMDAQGYVRWCFIAGQRGAEQRERLLCTVDVCFSDGK